MTKRTLTLFLTALYSICVLSQNDEKLELVNLKNEQINSAAVLNNLTSLFHPKISIRNLDNTIAKGLDDVKAYYQSEIAKEIHLTADPKNAITFKKYYLIREISTTSEGQKERLAIYQFKKGKIKQITIINPTYNYPNSLPAVQKLTDGYIYANLDGFLSSLSSEIVECDFPDTCNIAGITAMRLRYKQYIGKQNCSYILHKRIVIGNLVIDDNTISLISGSTGTRNIAIYATNKTGKINRITFLGF